MIQSLHISGFKLFRELTLPKLGQLNLFVGENNTGKSWRLSVCMQVGLLSSIFWRLHLAGTQAECVHGYLTG